MRISSLLLLSSFLLPSFSTVADITTHSLLRKDGSEINYHLDIRDKQNRTLLVLMQGSDCNSIKNNQFIQKSFGQWLTNSDVLMVEKYGITDRLPYSQYENERIDCPKSYTLHDNPTQRTEDYNAVLDYLSPNYSNIILIGGSEGATMVHLVIEKRKDIHAAIALNGGGRFFLDDVLYNIRHTAPEVQRENAVHDFLQFVDAIKNNQIEDNQSPILIIQTLNDTNVDVDAFHQLSKNITQPNVTFIKYDELDHGFYTDKGERMTNEIINDIQQWYSQHAK